MSMHAVVDRYTYSEVVKRFLKEKSLTIPEKPPVTGEN